MSAEGDNGALPGFEQMLATRAQKDAEDVGANVSHKEFTAETLAAKYPGKYALAARAFFEKNRSMESICDILQISPNTMRAVVERESAARGIFTLRERIRVRCASVAMKAVTRLQELLDDPDAVRKAGIAGLTTAIKALTPEAGKVDGKTDGETDDRRTETDEDDYIEMVTDGNGFYREKNPAREAEGHEPRASAPNPDPSEPSPDPAAGAAGADGSDASDDLATPDCCNITMNQTA